MVSTQSTQYITDFTPTTAEPGKSPLALLAKTCETIGLPEGSAKKSAPAAGSPNEKRDEKRDQSHQSKQKASPRSTPQSKEPTLTFPGLPKPAFPMGVPSMGFPFFNPMMNMNPYQMPFPGFPMGGYMGVNNRMPCPFAMMRQPCVNPGCMQCQPSTSKASNQISAEMMSQFAAHPLFSMYAGMMPTMPGVPTSSYQNLLAASAASTLAHEVPSTSKPSTSTSSPTTPPKKSTKFQCSWVESDVKCGKAFEEESELNAHVKKMHTPSPPSSASSEQSSGAGKARSAAATPHRFNPYGKPSAPSAPILPTLGMNPLVLPFSFQAMYANRFPTVAHQ